MWLKYSFLVVALNERTIQVLNDKGVSQENIDFIDTIDKHLQWKLVSFLVSNPNATMDQLIFYANSLANSSITNYISSSTLEPTFANWLQYVSTNLVKRNPELQATELPQQWKTVFNGINDWVHSKVTRDPSFALDKGQSFEDIKHLSDEWHSQFKTDAVTVLQKIPETTIYSPEHWNGWYIEYLVGQLAHDVESDAMNNCTSQYGKKSERDELYIFSLRDAEGKSHATIEYFANGNLKDESGIGNGPIEPEAESKIKEWKNKFRLNDNWQCEECLQRLSLFKRKTIFNAVSNGITENNIKYIPYLPFKNKMEIGKNNPILLKLLIKNKIISINEAIEGWDHEAVELLIANGAQPNKRTFDEVIKNKGRWIIEKMIEIGPELYKDMFNEACKTPKTAYEHAVNIEKPLEKLSDEIRNTVCKDPYYACEYAINVELPLGQLSAKIRNAVCKDIGSACNYARGVELPLGQLSDEIRNVVCKDPEYAYWYAKDVELPLKKLSDEVRNAVCQTVVTAYGYAKDVELPLKKLSDEVRNAICKNLYSISYGYLYARDVEKPLGQLSDEIRNVVCKNSDYAYKYAKDVELPLKKLSDEVRKAVCKYPYSAYKYAVDIELPLGQFSDEIRNAVCQDPEYAYEYAVDIELPLGKLSAEIRNAVRQDPGYAYKLLEILNSTGLKV
jgi:hypothetical protein